MHIPGLTAKYDLVAAWHALQEHPSSPLPRGGCPLEEAHSLLHSIEYLAPTALF